MKKLALVAALLLATPALADDTAPAATPSAAAVTKADKKAEAAKLTPVQQIFQVYEEMCVKTGGKIDRAKSNIEKLEKSGTLKYLADDQSKKMFGHDTKAWGTKTAAGTGLVVSYDPAGICGVHISQYDAGMVKNQFVEYVGTIQKAMGAKLEKKSDDKKQGNSLFSYYLLTVEGKPTGMAFGLSTTAPEAKQVPQHLLTFNLVDADGK